MTDANEALGEIHRQLTKLPPAGNGGPKIDAGAESIHQSGQLSATALRDAFEECAQRALETAQANVARAREDQLAAEKFAEMVRKHGETLAQKIEAGFNRATKMAASFQTMKAMISDDDAR